MNRGLGQNNSIFKSLLESSTINSVNNVGYDYNSSIMSIIKTATQLNKAMLPVVSELSKLQFGISKKIEPYFSLVNTVLKSKEFNSVVFNLSNSDFIKGIYAFNKYAEAINWDEEKLNHLLKQCYVKEYPEDAEKVQDDSFGSQLIFVIMALLTGMDFSVLKEESKRKIFLAQLIYFVLSLNASQRGCLNSDSFKENNRIEKVLCITSRGCVIRSGPGYKFSKVLAVPKGVAFKEIETIKDWTKVEFYSLEKGISFGWVKASLLTRE